MIKLIAIPRLQTISITFPLPSSPRDDRWLFDVINIPIAD